jgi:hypothetical protein
VDDEEATKLFELFGRDLLTTTGPDRRGCQAISRCLSSRQRHARVQARPRGSEGCR